MNSLRGKDDGKDKKQSSVFTKETLGVVVALFSTLVLVCLITRGSVFSAPGEYINTFLFGCFGYFAFLLAGLALITGVLMVADKKSGLTKKRKAIILCVTFLVALLVHIVSMRGTDFAYGEYLTESYLMAYDGGAETCSGGGFFTALLAYPVSMILSNVGSYVVLSILIVGGVYWFIKDFSTSAQKSGKAKTEKFRSSYVKSEAELPATDVKLEVKEYPVSGVDFSEAEKPSQKLFVNNAAAFGFKSNREIKNEEKTSSGILQQTSVNGLKVTSTSSPSYQKSYGKEMQERLDYIKKPAPLDLEKTLAKNTSYGVSVSKPIPQRTENIVKPTVNTLNTAGSDAQINQTPTPSIPLYEHDESVNTPITDTAEARAQSFSSSYAEIEDVETEIVTPVSPVESFYPAREELKAPSRIEEEPVIPIIEEKETEPDYSEERQFNSIEDTVEEQTQPVIDEEPIDTPAPSRIMREEGRSRLFGEENESLGFTSRVTADNNGRRSLFEDTPIAEDTVIDEPAPEKQKEPVPINREYFSPPLDLLENHALPINTGRENHQERMDIIQKTLEEFRINATPQSYIQGPSFTRYEINMPAGISVKSVLKYDDDLKMRLKAKDGVRIEAPIPGKDLVGIEVANTVKTMVGFRNVMEGLAQNGKKGSLVFAVGKDIVGNAISYDLAKGPHYLVAGATGSGKSVCLHVLIVSLLMRYSPEELKLVLVDPKSVEFRKYDHIPHLLVDEIITDAKRAITLLQWAYDETNRRNEMFTEYPAVSNIDDYNAQVASDTVAKLPRIVFVIDELADLMEACKKDLEEKIRKIAAKSRSAGIHLVLATQRPSVDVITGTIKANLPSRIALRVMNYADSATILSEGGAEKLLGNGDMLYKDSSMGNYERYQGAYISGREISNVVNYIKENNKAYFDESVKEFLDNETKAKPEDTDSPRSVDFNPDNKAVDELFLRALSLAVTSGNISISQLQRRFGIGYARAGGLVDKMERFGFVSGNEGSKARRVLLTREEYERQFGNLLD